MAKIARLTALAVALLIVPTAPLLAAADAVPT